MAEVPVSLVTALKGAQMDGVDAVHDAYRAHYRRLVGQLYALTRDLAEAQDVVQEAYARALARPARFLEVQDPEKWLRTVAMNAARTRYRRRWVLDRLLLAGRVHPPGETVPGMSPDRVALVAALRRLPRRTREAIVLHHIADLPIDEVAAALGVSAGTIKSRLSRGRAELARYLADDEPTTTARGAVDYA
jgi:RNA polymerase sigma-70 factor (sigma-E family)